MIADDRPHLAIAARDLRRLVLQMVYKAGSGHIGGSLSAAEIIAALYFSELRIDPMHPEWPDRDRFILSKGHACPVLYAALALRGYFPLTDLWRLRKLDGHLQGHPDMRKTPGIDATTGSLGQGISIACGMAIASKLRHDPYRVYTLLGCGELQEGQVWEAAMASAHHQLRQLTAIVDYNGLQIDGTNEEIMRVAPLAEKWQAFGWWVRSIDGHSLAEILQALRDAKTVTDRPQVIIARTVKGRGVSFMEDQVSWHSGAPSQAQLEVALAELGGEGNGV